MRVTGQKGQTVIGQQGGRWGNARGEETKIEPSLIRSEGDVSFCGELRVDEFCWVG